MGLSEERKAQMRIVSQFNYATKGHEKNLKRLEKRIMNGEVPFVDKLKEYGMTIERANELAGRVIFEKRADGAIIRHATRDGKKTSTPQPMVSKTRSVEVQTSSQSSVEVQTEAEPIAAGPSKASKNKKKQPVPTTGKFTKRMLIDLAAAYNGSKFKESTKNIYLNQIHNAFKALGVGDNDDVLSWYKNPQKLLDTLRVSKTSTGNPPSIATLSAWMGALGTWIHGKEYPMPELAQRLTKKEIDTFATKVEEAKVTVNENRDENPKDVYDWETVVKPSIERYMNHAKDGHKLFAWIMAGNVDGIPRPGQLLKTVAVKTLNSNPELKSIYAMDTKTIHIREHKTDGAYDVKFSVANAGPILNYIKKEGQKLFASNADAKFTQNVTLFGINFNPTDIRHSWDTMVYKLPEGPLKTRYLLAMRTVTAHSLQTSKEVYVGKNPITYKDLEEMNEEIERAVNN